MPDNLNGDPGRLRQILINLTGNAIKFTTAGEVVVMIGIEPEKTEDVRAEQGTNAIELHFQVKDTGKGIPPDKHETIFQPFDQVDGSTTREFGGSGLGLAISSQLVDLMGGKIWIESQLEKGSTFHFTAPVKQQHELSKKTELFAEADLCKLSVLAVDDNATNRLIIKEMLQGKVKELVLADSGPTALEILQQKMFQVVILDAQMPRMDGFMLARKIKRNPRTAKAKLIMLTSLGEKGDGTRCLGVGIAAYLLKPAGQQEILQSICKVLDKGTFEQEEEPLPLVTRHSIREHKKRLNVLLAEDEVINQTLAVAVLEQENMRLTTAENGKEAVEALDKDNFDLVLMDIQMPEMDGISATALIREKELKTGGHIPIIAITAHAMTGDREKCLEAGMDGYVSKPINVPQLKEEIAKVFRQYGQAESITETMAEEKDHSDYDTYLRERCNNIKSLANELIQCLLEERGPLWLAEAEAAIAEHNIDRIRHFGHSILEVAYNICIQSLIDVNAELGEIDEGGRRNQLPPAFLYLKEALEDL